MTPGGSYVLCSILSVGSELTSGQITNTNSSWISDQLKKLGLRTSLHVSVPDEHQAIRRALDFCEDQSEVLFVTGGLGPTSDDFTRDLVAEWSQSPLQFDESSWRFVQQKLSGRGYPIQEFQKQQCYFPQGCSILKNSLGTANAFFIEVRNCKVVVLPGPPREIEQIWNDHLDSLLKSWSAHQDPHRTLSWDTLGLGESQVAKIVEDLLTKSPLEIGYRVHLPYVEVKASYFESQKNQVLPLLNSLEKALAPITALRNGENLAPKLASKLERFKKISLCDQTTGGFLAQRWLEVASHLKNPKAWIFSSGFEANPPSTVEEDELYLWLRSENPTSTDSAKFSWRRGSGPWQERELISRLKSGEMTQRRRQYFAELSLLELWQGLD